MPPDMPVRARPLAVETAPPAAALLALPVAPPLLNEALLVEMPRTGIQTPGSHQNGSSSSSLHPCTSGRHPRAMIIKTNFTGLRFILFLLFSDRFASSRYLCFYAYF